MHVFRYQEYVLRYLHISRQNVSNVNKCPKVVSVQIQVAPIVVNNTRLLSAFSFISSLTGKSPFRFFKKNRRTKEQYVAGGVIVLRGKHALNFLISLRVLAFYKALNFKGFRHTLPNKTVSFTLKHIGFYVGSLRAFDNNLMDLQKNTTFAHVNVLYSEPDLGLTVLRSLGLPFYEILD